MANQAHLDRLKRAIGPGYPIELWNQWRKEPAGLHPDLSGARLDGAYLVGVDLSEADLSRAELYGAQISRGSVIRNAFRANFSGAILAKANLSNSDLREANLSGAVLLEANLSGSNLHQANLSGADLMRATLVETNLAGATLTDCHIYGISAWNVKLEEARQNNLVITPPAEPTITVDDLEVAQFIYLLLNHQKLRNVLNAVTERGVLLLGRFGGGGLDVLQAVAAKLREEKYLPIIFDFERPQNRDYTETVKTLAGLARFIIVDLSGPSVPQELSHTVPFFDIPFVPILEKGRNSYAMFVDLFKYPWVLKPLVEFANVADLLARVPSQIIVPAEERHRARQQLLDDLFRRE